VHAPVLMWRGTADPNAPDAWNAAVVRSGLPTPPEEHVVPNAGHFVFTPVCTDATAKQVPFLCDDPPGAWGQCRQYRAGWHRADRAEMLGK
jgi:hypothetical protein